MEYHWIPTKNGVPCKREGNGVCPACDAGIPATPRTITSVNWRAKMPSKIADIVRKAPNGCVYAYLRERNRGQISYQVILVSMAQISYKLTDAPEAKSFQIGSQDPLGWVVKQGTKFFPMLPDGRLRRKGSSSLKKATGWLFQHRKRG